MAMNLKDRAKSLKKDIPTIYFVLKDKDTPWIAKLFAGITVIYALSPIDLIPDFIPVLGYLDDVILLPLMIAITIRFIPKELWKRHHDEAKAMWSQGTSKKWYYAIPIVLFWFLILWFILKIIFF
ncbi:YkvA family protein [[Eubacterium] hominis]|uniref:YkvA family protein n=1 Tax=[Eubacterium] hominis TaxID=2764325 RepID=UPI003A4D9D5A